MLTLLSNNFCQEIADAPVDNGVAITFICATVSHKNLPPIGFCLWLIVILQFLYLYHKLTCLGGFFYDKNRLF